METEEMHVFEYFKIVPVKCVFYYPVPKGWNEANSEIPRLKPQ